MFRPHRVTLVGVGEPIEVQAHGVNRDFFTGKPIREGDIGQQAWDMAEYGAGQLIQPLQTIMDTAAGKRSGNRSCPSRVRQSRKRPPSVTHARSGSCSIGRHRTSHPRSRARIDPL